MASLTESPALLTVHQGASGQFVIRVTDLKRTALITSVTKQLVELGAESLVVITPNDIKVFNVSGNGNQPHAEGETDSVPLDDETLAAIAVEEGRAIPGQSEEPTIAEAPVPRTRKRAPRAAVAGHDESCGRCSGTGKIKVLMDGGSAGETTCGICKGEGKIIRYGARR